MKLIKKIKDLREGQLVKVYEKMDLTSGIKKEVFYAKIKKIDYPSNYPIGIDLQGLHGLGESSFSGRSTGLSQGDNHTFVTMVGNIWKVYNISETELIKIAKTEKEQRLKEAREKARKEYKKIRATFQWFCQQIENSDSPIN